MQNSELSNKTWIPGFLESISENKWIICFVILWTAALVAYYFFAHKIRNYINGYDPEQVKKEKEKW